MTFLKVSVHIFYLKYMVNIHYFLKYCTFRRLDRECVLSMKTEKNTNRDSALQYLGEKIGETCILHRQNKIRYRFQCSRMSLPHLWEHNSSNFWNYVAKIVSFWPPVLNRSSNVKMRFPIIWLWLNYIRTCEVSWESFNSLTNFTICELNFWIKERKYFCLEENCLV